MSVWTSGDVDEWFGGDREEAAEHMADERAQSEWLDCGCHGSQREHTCGPPDDIEREE